MLPRPKPATHKKKPRRSEWNRNRVAVIPLHTDRRCPVCLTTPLWQVRTQGACERLVFVGVVDHLIAERIVRKLKLGRPHDVTNLLAVCKVCHSRKTAIEKHLEAADLLRFQQEINALGWPALAVSNALRHYGLMR